MLCFCFLALDFQSIPFIYTVWFSFKGSIKTFWCLFWPPNRKTENSSQNLHHTRVRKTLKTRAFDFACSYRAVLLELVLFHCVKDLQRSPCTTPWVADCDNLQNQIHHNEMVTITTNITHTMPVHLQKGNNNLNFMANILSLPRSRYSLPRNMVFEVRCKEDSDSHSRLLQTALGSPDWWGSRPIHGIFPVRYTQIFYSDKHCSLSSC